MRPTRRNLVALRQNLGERVPRFVDPRDGGSYALPHIPGHRAGGIEYNHGVFVAWSGLGLLCADVAGIEHNSHG